jgi:hypothetical protein
MEKVASVVIVTQLAKLAMEDYLPTVLLVKTVYG